MGKDFLEKTTQSTRDKSKIRQIGLYETKKVCIEKETVIRVNRQPTEWEKIFAMYISDHGLIFKIYLKAAKIQQTPRPK
jgi:hypothetical protein